MGILVRLFLFLLFVGGVDWQLLGDGIWDLVDTLGLVSNFNVLFANNIFTVCPEHIKLILATDFDNYAKGACMPFIVYPPPTNLLG